MKKAIAFIKGLFGCLIFDKIIFRKLAGESSEFNERIKEIGQFMNFALSQWPITRPKVIGTLSQRCAVCIVNEHYSPLVEGICQECRKEKREGDSAVHDNLDLKALEAEHNQLLKSYEGKGTTAYNALVLFSGGKDSTYLLYKLKEEFPKLRILALFVDNGFASQVAKTNAKNVSAALNIDFQHFTPKPELYQKAFRHALLHLNEGGCYTTVDRIDGHLTFDIGRNVAARLQIPLLIAGISVQKIENILKIHSYESPFASERARRETAAGFPLSSIFSKGEIEAYWWNGAKWPKERIPRVIYPYYVWRYDEQFLRDEVVRLGLIKKRYYFSGLSPTESSFPRRRESRACPRGGGDRKPSS